MRRVRHVRSLGAVVAAASIAGGVSACNDDSGAQPPPVPATGEELVRAYARAVADRDAEAVCRLSHGTHTAPEGCVVNTTAELNHPDVVRDGWRHISVRAVRVRADGGLLRPRVDLSYVTAAGSPRELRDTWWLQRRLGRLAILRAGAFDSRALGPPGALVETDRPLRPGQVARPAELRPRLACVPTRRSSELQRASVREYRDGAFRSIDVPWLDLVRVEVGRAADARACLRLYAAARWRVATSVGLSVDGVRRGRLLRAVDLEVRIDGRGRIRPVDVSRRARAGADGRAMTFVLPRRLAVGGNLRISVDSASLQAGEPLLRDIVNAGDPLETLRIGRHRARASGGG